MEICDGMEIFQDISEESRMVQNVQEYFRTIKKILEQSGKLQEIPEFY